MRNFPEISGTENSRSVYVKLKDEGPDNIIKQTQNDGDQKLDKEDVNDNDRRTTDRYGGGGGVKTSSEPLIYIYTAVL